LILVGRWLFSFRAFCFLARPESVAAEPPAIISEFMAANSSTWRDELFPVRSERFLTDDSDLPNKWMFPATNVPPNGRLIVFAPGKDRRAPGSRWHSNFQLSPTSFGSFAHSRLAPAQSFHARLSDVFASFSLSFCAITKV
jgi:hypothetical protein